MKLTVLIAVRNGGAYLQEAVRSVLEQSFERFELLLVDDASTDGAVDELPRDPRIRVLRNGENIGQVPSLNRGLREAQGEYVARLDADDVMLPARLARQIAVLDGEPRVALVGTWMHVVDERGHRLGTTRGRIDGYLDFVNALLTDDIPFGHPSITYRRETVCAVGGYDASLAPAEDKDLYRRLALERLEARVVEEPLVVYRRHRAQLSQVQVTRQVLNDRAGQERFLSELAPDVPARTLRLLLTVDPEFWASPPPANLDAFLDATAQRLRLTASERDALGQLLGRQCVRTLRTAWSTRHPVTYDRAGPLTTFAAEHGGIPGRTSKVLLPLLLALRPLGAALERSRTRARRTVRRSRRFGALRRLARRSRALRRLYTALLGFRLLDDEDGV